MSIAYAYDAGGRLLRRARTSGGATDCDSYYWLGLSPIAEEKGFEAAPIVRPDGEAGTDPAVNGWHLYCGNGGAMIYVQDELRGKVLRLSSGSAQPRSGCFLLGDTAGNANLNGNPLGANKKGVELWLRNADPAHAPASVALLVRLEGGQECALNFELQSAFLQSYNGACHYLSLPALASGGPAGLQ